ncbi:MAG TPA: very short patch repair endonuclease [Terracidiphilus sp.]|nr:very short patch repair endonuclease [Terracidiphilus sp.]
METPETRRHTMQAVKSKDTGPEMFVRRLLHAQGYRYRLHSKVLPGSPDLVFSSREKVIFVHGCFWHGHHCARGNRVPIHNREYWVKKIERNRKRDLHVARLLRQLGWKRKVIWECSLKNPERLRLVLDEFLTS